MGRIPSFAKWTFSCALFLCNFTSIAWSMEPALLIERWVTSPGHQMAKMESLQWTPIGPIGKDSSARGAHQIHIDESKTAQTVLGFGAALTDSSCYLINKLPEPARQNLIDEIYNPSKMGMSTTRIAIGSSDYALTPYSFDDGEADPDLKRFSIAHDEENILPVLRMARKSNPDLFIFGSPWSPPGWMKSNKSLLGGCMQRTYLSSYASYFSKFLKAYESAGVPVQAVTVNNEVDTDQDGRMPACLWGQEVEMDFVASHLGPQLERDRTNSKIWILDHNYNMWGRVLNELENTDVRKYTNGVAWHPYAGNVDAMSKVHKVHPNIGMHWTEDGPDVDEPGYATNWCKWGRLFTEALRNSCNSITGWNLALDEAGKPNIGPFKCGGTITINSKTQAVSYSGQYWGTVHFSKFIRPGARIVLTDSLKPTAIHHIAAKNPDGKVALVLTNPTARSQNLSLRCQNNVCDFTVPADSIVSLRW